MFKKPQKQDASGQVSTEKVVGFFKGIIEVESKEDKLNFSRLSSFSLSRPKPKALFSAA